MAFGHRRGGATYRKIRELEGRVIGGAAKDSRAHRCAGTTAEQSHPHRRGGKSPHGVEDVVGEHALLVGEDADQPDPVAPSPSFVVDFCRALGIMHRRSQPEMGSSAVIPDLLSYSSRRPVSWPCCYWSSDAAAIGVSSGPWSSTCRATKPSASTSN